MQRNYKEEPVVYIDEILVQFTCTGCGASYELSTDDLQEIADDQGKVLCECGCNISVAGVLGLMYGL